MSGDKVQGAQEGVVQALLTYRHSVGFRSTCLAAVLSAGLVGWPAANASPPAKSTIADIALQQPFHTRSPWRFVAAQDPPVQEGPNDPDAFETPGIVHLCLQSGPAAPCDPGLIAMPQPPKPPPYIKWEPHYLNNVSVVYPRDPTAPPLLLIQTGTEHSGDGDQAIFTQLLAYHHAQNRFEQVYARLVPRNNNQEVRYIVSGPLQGAMISVEPTSEGPYYRVTVDTMTPSGAYRPTLHYIAATRYNDGNPLPVIDSEMPNIQKRLGLWRRGMQYPLPAEPCQKPRLLRMELWCQ